MPAITKDSEGKPHTCTWVKARRGESRSGFGAQIYKCEHPQCFSFRPRRDLIGKESLCTKCFAPILLNREMLRRSRPVCENCSQTQEAKEKRQIVATLKEIGID